jgi:plasmid stabilization system protein ParE
MTRRRLEIREEALAEAIEARRWYAQWSPAAADLFLAELDDIFDSILRSPERWPVYTRRTRRALLRRFPYLIVYRVLDDRIVVVAIAHANRRPGYWHDRVRET